MPSFADAAQMPGPSNFRHTTKPLPKSYAVFLATYDPTTGKAVGGVAGSAFFITPSKAITAYHVLQPNSFANPQTQVWLVHEGEPAIELRAENLVPDSRLDRTTITLHDTEARLVYELAKEARPSRPLLSRSDPPIELTAHLAVETDGFLANSAGPQLAPRSDGHLTITAVPTLERLHAEGHLLRRQAVDLISQDVNLKQAPCVQLSYKPVVGLSGGPVLNRGRVIGMNSFADPKARASTWAVSLD